MKYFIDTEFNAPGSGKPIDLISIAIVAEDGREFYAVNTWFDWNTAGSWLYENVKPHLKRDEGGTTFAGVDWFPELIREFIGDDPAPEFWGYYCAFDYVMLSQLMGGMDEWPEYWPYLMYDLRQSLDERNLQAIRQPDGALHNALDDARWVRDAFVRHVEGRR